MTILYRVSHKNQRLVVTSLLALTCPLVHHALGRRRDSPSIVSFMTQEQLVEDLKCIATSYSPFLQKLLR